MRQALKPTHLIVVWDGGLSGERMELLPEYKAQRPEMPPDLRDQLDQICGYLEAAGVAQYRGDGIEADDYIASLARHVAADGWSVVIASSDKDFMQLVSDRIGLLNPNDKSGTVWGRKQVLAKTGIEPGQVLDWLALMGDAVDNIPGVPGVGPKTAADLLKQFNSIEGMAARLGEIRSERVRGLVQEWLPVIRRNQELVRLADVPCEWNPEHLVARPANQVKLLGLFESWGFKGMSAALNVTAITEKQAELI